VASFYPSLYKDEASRLAASMTMENPAMIAMLGPGYETEAYLASPGPFFANEMLLFTAIAAAIMNILLVSQSTRGDEEAGRLEIVQARSVGKVAYTNAVMIIIFGANVLLSLLIGIGIGLLQIEGMDWQSTMLFGSVLGLTGLVFGAMTLVIAQLVESARSVTMFSLMVLILSYLIRAIGDVNYEWLSYASPLGWTVRTKVFADDDWLPVIVLSVLTVFFGLLALYLHAKRDIGSGYFTPRKGRSHASKLLLTPFGFHLWMQKTNIAAWTLAIFVLSWSMGFVMGDMESYWQDIELIEQFLAADMQAEMTEQWSLPGVLNQQKFYSSFIAPHINKGERVFVIISDALRYEIGVELAERLNAETIGICEIQSMLGIIPSVTKLGMAALLPHKTIDINESGQVLVNGQVSSELEHRKSILEGVTEDSIAIYYQDIL
ncbi:MAG: PglZ domain-containing protein, partial [Bacillales bacterium]